MSRRLHLEPPSFVRNIHPNETSAPGKPAALEKLGDLGLIEKARDAVIVRDPADRVVFWNHGAQILYGWSRREALGLGIHDLLRTRFSGDRSEAVAALERDGEWDGHVHQQTRDGTELIVWTRWTALKDDVNEIVAVLEVARDVTAEQRSLAALRARLAELESAAGRHDAHEEPHGNRGS